MVRQLPRLSSKRYFPYQTATGAIWCRVATEKLPDGRTRSEVWCYAEQINGSRTWRRMLPCSPYPLYNLPTLNRRKDVPILLTQDEETSHNQRLSWPDYVTTAILNVPDGLTHCDLSPFAGRAVFILPGDRGSPWALEVVRAVESVAPQSITIISHDQSAPLASGKIAPHFNDERVGRIEPIHNTEDALSIAPKSIDGTVCRRLVGAPPECAIGNLITELEPEVGRTDRRTPAAPTNSTSVIGPKDQVGDDGGPTLRRRALRNDGSLPPPRHDFVRLPYDVAMDFRLAADALTVLAYRATFGSDYSLNHIDAHKYLGIGKDRFYDIIRLLRHLDYLRRRQTRSGGEFGKAIEEVHLDAIASQRSDYFVHFRSVFEQSIPAKSLGLYLSLCSLPTNEVVSLSQIGSRFAWSDGTTRRHLRALFAKGLVERRQLRNIRAQYAGTTYLIP